MCLLSMCGIFMQHKYPEFDKDPEIWITRNIDCAQSAREVPFSYVHLSLMSKIFLSGEEKIHAAMH
jgi:hypothetical protein